jgi:hypothetical protein
MLLGVVPHFVVRLGTAIDVCKVSYTDQIAAYGEDFACVACRRHG